MAAATVFFGIVAVMVGVPLLTLVGLGVMAVALRSATKHQTPVSQRNMWLFAIGAITAGVGCVACIFLASLSSQPTIALAAGVGAAVVAVAIALLLAGFAMCMIRRRRGAGIEYHTEIARSERAGDVSR
ncbi:MAG TPA: hypothetical protein VK157_12490 [Phycisphaerales bacterium]|nr:hypothetical protein [Phycisphaerales bacterium]